MSLELFLPVLMMVYNNIFTAASALEFYVIIRRPTQNDLKIFKANLPKILQLLYFSSNNANIYRRYTQRIAIDYLLYEKKNLPSILFSLAINITVFITVLILLIIGDIQNNKITGWGVIGYMIMIIIFVRTLFFGFKLKRDPTYYFPE